MTLRYQTDSWGTENNGFTLIITAFKNLQTFGCSEAFQCDSNICINPELVCDGVSHCGHGEDESDHSNCPGESLLSSPVLGDSEGNVNPHSPSSSLYHRLYILEINLIGALTVDDIQVEV